MLVDATVLLYAVNSDSPFAARAQAWLDGALNGPHRVAIPWQSYWAFLRVATNPRVSSRPLTVAEAWTYIRDWMSAPTTWIPEPGFGHAAILEELMVDRDIRGALVSDAVLAALCLEHGLSIVSADSDFARFPQITWINPIAP